MKIDDKEFKSYLLDNEYTVKRRIAILNNTIPDFLHLEKVSESDNEYNSINLIKKIQEANINLLENIKKLNNKYFYLSFLDLMCLWCYIKYKGFFPSGDNVDFFEFTIYIEKNNLRSDYIENEIPFFLKKIKDKINNIKQTVENEVKILEYFDKLNEAESTNLEVTKIKKEYIYTVNIDSCSFFDSINLSNDIPFATLKDFYKIYKGFKPLTKWIFLNDDLTIVSRTEQSIDKIGIEKDIICLKVSNVKNTPLIKENEPNGSDGLDIENYDKEQQDRPDSLENEKKIQSLKEEIYNNVYITFKSSWDEYLEEKLKKQKIESREQQRLKLLKIAIEKGEKEEKEEKELYK